MVPQTSTIQPRRVLANFPAGSGARNNAGSPDCNDICQGQFRYSCQRRRRSLVYWIPPRNLPLLFNTFVDAQRSIKMSAAALPSNAMAVLSGQRVAIKPRGIRAQAVRCTVRCAGGSASGALRP
eukprot:505914-Prorocentrum_minimum.AAC.1